MSDSEILSLIFILFLCLILTIFALVFYAGLLSEVVVKTGPPPVKKITIAYKFVKGADRDSGALFTQSCSIAPKLSNISVRYDDFSQAQSEICRYAVGSILSENEEPEEELRRLYETFGFRVITFPEVSVAVTSSFPNRCPLSPACGAYRVFPELISYIKERRLSAYPYLEITKDDLIHYICPLENQEGFIVPELLEKKEEVEAEVKEEKTEDSKDDDVTETGEHCMTESSPLIEEAESRETEAESRVTEAESKETEETLPEVQQSQQQNEGDEQSEEGDPAAKSSSESVGSGSSFEELEMDMEEEEKEKKERDDDHVKDNEERA